MTKEEVKEEINKLENEAKQLLANANFINGAIVAFNKVLASLSLKEMSEKKDDSSNTTN